MSPQMGGRKGRAGLSLQGAPAAGTWQAVCFLWVRRGCHEAPP